MHSSVLGRVVMDELRQRFEKWITSPPFEKRIARFADDPEQAAWPGSYRQIEVELAWQAWQEAAKQSAGLKLCPCCGETPEEKPQQELTGIAATSSIIGRVVCSCGLSMVSRYGQATARMRWNQRR
jgi:hypothetical protein